MTHKIKPSKINRNLPEGIEKVTKPMGKIALEIYLKNNGFTEQLAKEFIEKIYSH